MYKTQKDISKSKSGILYCSHKCSRLNIDNDKFPSGEDHHNYKNGEASYRDLAFRNYKNECSVCTYNIKEVLEVHHKDGNRENNEINNLDILCPTHHTEYQIGIRKYG